MTKIPEPDRDFVAALFIGYADLNDVALEGRPRSRGNVTAILRALAAIASSTLAGTGDDPAARDFFLCELEAMRGIDPRLITARITSRRQS